MFVLAVIVDKERDKWHVNGLWVVWSARRVCGFNPLTKNSLLANTTIISRNVYWLYGAKNQRKTVAWLAVHDPMQSAFIFLAVLKKAGQIPLEGQFSSPSSENLAPHWERQIFSTE